MNKSSIVLICLLVITMVFSYTVVVTAFEPSIKQNDNPKLGEKTISDNPQKLKPPKNPRPILLGDPIENPKPH